MRVPGADTAGIDALRTDLYVESLLETIGPRVAVRTGGMDADPDVAEAARTLRATLVRPHPSFRFEERLSRRLAELAIAMRRAAVATLDGRATGELVAFPGAGAIAVGDPAPDPLGRGGLGPVLAGGAVASAALSIGAAALVAWRRTHVRRGIG